MLIDLSEAVYDCEIGSCFVIFRQTGSFGSGGWVANAPKTINAFGIVTVATPKELEMVPEGDRVKGSLHIIYGQRLYTTWEANGPSVAGQIGGGTSDQIQWDGQLYRVQAVEPWGPMLGFWHAVAVRMRGA
jgi:hypothetical protein